MITINILIKEIAPGRTTMLAMCVGKASKAEASEVRAIQALIRKYSEDHTRAQGGGTIVDVDKSFLL